MSDERPAVLIAEDDAQIRHLIRERLEVGGYRTRLARTGEEAIAALEGWSFDAMILDINMPGVDGFGVLAARARVRRFPPTMMLTARHAGADVQRAIALGAKDYLTKPFTEAQLMARLARLMRSRPPAAAEVLL